MVRHRIRLYFEKERDLRFLGHRDLMRLLIRMLRTAGIQVANSQGFHPKPKISFPSALPLGVEGLGEIMELETTVPYTAVELQDTLNACSVSGLRFHSSEVLVEGALKARPVSYTWRFPVPNGHRQEYQQKITAIQSGRLTVEGKNLQEALLSIGIVTLFQTAPKSPEDRQDAAEANHVNTLNTEDRETLENREDLEDREDFEDREDQEDRLVKQDYIRFTIKADDSPGNVSYKDCLSVLGLTPVCIEDGPYKGLMPMLNGVREVVSL